MNCNAYKFSFFAGESSVTLTGVKSKEDGATSPTVPSTSKTFDSKTIFSIRNKNTTSQSGISNFNGNTAESAAEQNNQSGSVSSSSKQKEKNMPPTTSKGSKVFDSKYIFVLHISVFEKDYLLKNNCLESK